MISVAADSGSASGRENNAGKTARSAAAAREALHDRELVRRFNADGDESAFVEIIDRYRERMFGVVLALLKNHADAEEITQDTFVRAHRALGNFRGDSSLSTWLHRVALNLARNRYWHNFRRRRHLSQPLDVAFSADNPATLSHLIASDEPDPARVAVTNEFSVLVRECMERLNEPTKEILTLRNILHRSYQEIARELGITSGTVKSRLARARARLREQLAEACPEFGAGAQPADWFDAIRPRGGVEVLSA
jgi:RNA polymerase sigma-70 factor (ECF subfamily)